MAAPDRTPEPSSSPTTTKDKAPILVPEEIDSSKWEMPPWTPIGIVLLVILVGMGIFSYLTRPKPKVIGTIDEVYAVALPENKILLTMKVDIQNVGSKSMWIRRMTVKTVTNKGEFLDDPANAVDFPRYFAGFPDLRSHSTTPIKVEDKIDPGLHERGSIIASFPLTLDEFSARKSISLIIEPYDQEPITITK